MDNLLFFKINDGKPKQFARVQEGKPFTFSINEFPTVNQLEKLKETGGDHILVRFTDEEGNNFSIVSIPDIDEEYIKNKLLRL